MELLLRDGGKKINYAERGSGCILIKDYMWVISKMMLNTGRVLLHGQIKESIKELFREIECMALEYGMKQMDRFAKENGSTGKEYNGCKSYRKEKVSKINNNRSKILKNRMN